jgi:hypothetical protein
MVGRQGSIASSLSRTNFRWANGNGKIQFLNERIGFVSLKNFDQGAILKTSDGGATWVRLPINDEQRNANLEGVGFIDEKTGWVGGWGDRDFERRNEPRELRPGHPAAVILRKHRLPLFWWRLNATHLINLQNF